MVLLLSLQRTQPTIAPSGKPKVIEFYNSTKGGVDDLDKLVATYRSKRQTKRWPMALFDNIVDVSAYNAFVLWNIVQPNWKGKATFKRRIFLQELGLALVQPVLSSRVSLPRTPNARQVAEAARPSIEYDNSQSQERAAKRQRCHMCKNDNKVTTICSVCRKNYM